MRRIVGFGLAAALAVVGLTACMSDDSSSTRGERRAAALVAAGDRGGARVQLTLETLTPPGQAIEVLDYAWGVSAAGGAAQFEDLTIKKTMDEVSPKLFEALAIGRATPRGELRLYKTTDRGAVNYATYFLEQVLIKSLQHSGDGSGEGHPQEQVSLAYGRIRLETKLPVDDQGNLGPPVRFGWDLGGRRPW